MPKPEAFDFSSDSDREHYRKPRIKREPSPASSRYGKSRRVDRRSPASPGCRHDYERRTPTSPPSRERRWSTAAPRSRSPSPTSGRRRFESGQRSPSPGRGRHFKRERRSPTPVKFEQRDVKRERRTPSPPQRNRYKRERMSSSASSNNDTRDPFGASRGASRFDVKKEAAAFEGKRTFHQGFRGPAGAKDYGEFAFQITAKTTEKSTFYCYVCNVELNSIETKETHVNGRRHRENLDCSGLDDAEAVKIVRNPSPIRRKIIEDLHTKLMRSSLPAVGLKHIKEFLPVSFAKDMDPYYECVACGKLGDGNALFNHIMGKDHRILAVGTSSEAVAKKHMENSRSKELIETKRDDATYPWPPGKAPWSLEQGGNGVPPPEARGKFVSHDPKKPFSIRGKFPNSSITEANKIHFIDFAKALASRLDDYFGNDESSNEDDDDGGIRLADLTEAVTSLDPAGDGIGGIKREEPEGDDQMAD